MHRKPHLFLFLGIWYVLPPATSCPGGAEAAERAFFRAAKRAVRLNDRGRYGPDWQGKLLPLDMAQQLRLQRQAVRRLIK